MSLILEDEDALFTGDNVLGHETAVFENLAVYLDSLEKMSGLSSGRAYPGHGAVIEDSKARILEYISHRQEREVSSGNARVLLYKMMVDALCRYNIS